MKQRNAFTLVELIISVFIFSYIAASLATIYSTTNRHMFQNYRRNVIKTDVLVSMRAIQAGLTQATRLDLPAPGTQNNVLAFAFNVDQNSSCYPVNGALTASWHYYCRGADPLIAGSWNLYHHTADLPAGTPCGNPAASVWNGVYPVPNCGANIGGQTVTLMMRHVSPPSGFMFSRRAVDGVDAVGAVRVTLRSFWSAAGRGFGASQRDVDFSLDSVVTVNRSN
ncbi:MAG: type II secretion system protein [Elusimicrobiales bacterium]|nr:type II secretion system protein [Elusimicrobiales bacterium]